MKYENILFDLDGTLTDSGSGIMGSAKYAIEKAHLVMPSDEVMKKFIGPPLSYSFEKYSGAKGNEITDAIKYYREYYSEKGIFENEVYDGVYEMLEKLKKTGAKLILATSKPRPFTLRILEHFELSSYFDFVSASELDGTRGEKDEVIAYIFENLDIEKEKTLMVGDRLHDIDGAHKNGIKCATVLYGFGNAKEFSEHGADYVIEKPGDLLGIIL